MFGIAHEQDGGAVDIVARHRLGQIAKRGFDMLFPRRAGMGDDVNGAISGGARSITTRGSR